ncbi:MAG: ABC transporter ATP-binding protein [Candidatus Poribacteria bacterium]|nr:ABC transporter ATP-binding protein [Candidatus Poribacteria bacterium]
MSTENPKAVGKRFLEGVFPYWPQIVKTTLCMTVMVGFSLLIPLFTKLVIDRAITQQDQKLLWIVCLGGVGSICVYVLLSLIRDRFYIYTTRRILLDFRNRFFQHLLRLPMPSLTKRQTGEYGSMIINDVDAILTSATYNVLHFFTDTLSAVAIISIMFYFNWRLALIALIVVPLNGLTYVYFRPHFHKATLKRQEATAATLSYVQQTLAAIRLVKSFSAEKHHNRSFFRESKLLLFAQAKVSILESIAGNISQLVVRIQPIVIICFGGLEVLENRLTIGELVAFSAYLEYLSAPVYRILHFHLGLAATKAVLQRLFQVLDLTDEHSGDETLEKKKLDDVVGHIQFQSVHFAYQEIEVLKAINLDVRPGSIVALVGPSGSGKTTLTNLIPRLYEPNAGRLLLDGHDLQTLDLKFLRQQIGIVPQEPVLFDVSIKENIRYGCPSATDEAVYAAAQAANIHEFIVSLPDGYETQIGERGFKLSGGQKQRVAIAMAILRNPKILILDEATSALDSQSEALIQEALQNVMKQRTTFVIAHRLSTIRNADQIVVMDQGEIVEVGSHSDLLASGKLYSRLYREQFKSILDSPETDI